jgi:signal transduction histidine kinase/DNA-binding response OmpR family regulator
LGGLLLYLLVVFAVAASAYAWYVNHQLSGDYAAATHSYAVANQVEALMNRVTDGETGERGFLITGQEEYLEPYVTFTSTIDGLYRQLRLLTAEDPVQSREVARLQPLLLARRKELESIIELRRENGLGAARMSASFNLGKTLHDEIRSVVSVVGDNERQTIGLRNADVEATSRRSQLSMALVTLTMASLGGGILLLGWLNKKKTHAAQSAMAAAAREKAQLQEELLRNFNLLARVGELAKIGGWELQMATNEIHWSPEVFRIHEVEATSPPPVGQALSFYAAEARGEILAAVESAGLNGGSWDLELPLITARGRRIWVRTMGSAVMHGGVVARLEGAFQDITERKRIEESLKLVNDQLVIARDQAEAASVAKSHFLSNMSHEIRTPMNAVMGMLQLLAQTDLVRRQLDYVHKAQMAAKSLLVILNDILDFSKIEAGKMSLDVSAFPLDGLMRYLALILSTSVGKKDIETLLDLDTALPAEINGDLLRVQQVLINLIGNAVKFTQQGEIVVSLKMTGRSEASVEIEFAVRDTGIGIAAESMERIFEGFAQAESSTARRFGGTGLGLAISRRLVRLMGGELQVASEAGAGSRFSFSLSFACSAAVPRNKYASIPIPGKAHGQRMRVLIVDDNESAREVLRCMVQSLGWDCDCVDSGAKALLLLKKGSAYDTRYDVVFMDWNMPEMDGWQATRHIRENHSAGGAPIIIIMISAHGREALVERLRDEPAVLDGFLIKPVTASMLFDAVADAKSGDAGVNAPSLKRPVSNRLKGLRLLVVEDNSMNQQVAYELLSNEGAQVTVAGNGRLGIQATLSARPPFDAVLMDIQMPDIDGRAATVEIRGHASMQSLPIIAMTANALAEDKAACLAAGMNDHIGKPIDLDLLVTTILQHCGGAMDDGRLHPATPSAAAAAQAPPTGAADIDREFRAALHRAADNREFFADMAKLFIRSCTTLAADLQRHILREDRPGAAALLHTLRGTAGIVGAVELVNYALRMEQQLKLGDDAASAAFSVDEFDGLIRRNCNALRIFADTLTWASESGILNRDVLDKSQLAALLDTLDQALREKNMQATQVFDDLRFACGSALGDRLTALEEAMDELNFPLSLELTRILRHSFL